MLFSLRPWRNGLGLYWPLPWTPFWLGIPEFADERLGLTRSFRLAVLDGFMVLWFLRA